MPQWGGLEYVKSRDIPEGFVVKQARIVRKASGYFVMLTLECDVFVPEIMPHGHPVGIDLGQDLFVAKSEGDGLTGTGNHLVKNPGSSAVRCRTEGKPENGAPLTKRGQKGRVREIHNPIVNKRLTTPETETT